VRRKLHIALDLDAAPIIRHHIDMKRPSGSDVLRRSHCLLELRAIQTQRVKSNGFALGIFPHQREQLIARRTRPKERLRA
jgi:hypothetical protein